MNAIELTRTVALFSTGLLAIACADSDGAGPTPDIQSKELPQLSAGGGIAGYDFGWTNGSGEFERFGTVLVTADISDDRGTPGDPSDDIIEQTEHWRWDQDALDDIEADEVDYNTFELQVVSQTEGWEEYSASELQDALVAHFDTTETQAWTEWSVNRQFTVAPGGLEWNNPGAGSLLYTFEATSWVSESSTITYFLKFDFSNPPAGSPVDLSWYVDAADYLIHQLSNPDDDTYEVSPVDGNNFTQTSVGIMYELTPVTAPF